MHCYCGTNNRAPRWKFTDPCKPEVRPGAPEESVSPVWLAAPAMNARDTTKGTFYEPFRLVFKSKKLNWPNIVRQSTIGECDI